MADRWHDYGDDYEEESLEELREILREPPTAITGPLLSVLDVAGSLLQRLPGLQGDHPLKLHQLCYLVQALHLGKTAVPAFQEPIVASSRGPVIEKLAKSSHDGGLPPQY